MKSYRMGHLPLGFLLIVAIVLAENQQNIGFLKLNENLSEENRKSYSILRDLGQEVGIDFEKTNLKSHYESMSALLNQTIYLHRQTSRILSDSCASIKTVHDQMKNLPKLDENSKNFSKTAEWVVRDEAAFLNNTITKVRDLQSTALKYMDQIRKKLTSFYGIRIYLKEDLKHAAYAKKSYLNTEVSRNEQIRQRPCSAEIFDFCLKSEEIQEKAIKTLADLKTKLGKVKNFLDSSNYYMESLLRAGDDLSPSLRNDEMVFDHFKGFSEKIDMLLRQIQNLTSGQLAELNKKRIVDIQNEIDSAVQGINNECLTVNWGHFVPM